MEFQDVVRRRRMVRRYDDRPVEPASVERMLANAVRAPSAGFTQGWSFLVLDRPGDLARFWAVTAEDDGAADRWLEGMRTAPVLVVPLSSKAAYLDRYAESDKGWTDREEHRWPVPYWHIDTGMATLLILQTAVDEGLGACFFGIPRERIESFREEFGVPASYLPIGAVAVGHRTVDSGAPGSPASRARRPLDEVVHRGQW
jgi:nitroreductase